MTLRLTIRLETSRNQGMEESTPQVKLIRSALFRLAPWVASLGCFTTVHGALPILTAPRAIDGQFQFTLRGESKVSYRILSSTNLVDWTARQTNTSGLASSQLVSVPLIGSGALVRAQREIVPPFRFALAVREEINLGGHNFYVDSFDSADPAASTDGAYDPLKRRDGADVAAVHGLIDTAATGTTTVLGRLATGPDAAATLGAHGVIGSLPWFASGATGLEPGAWTDDLGLEMEAPARFAIGFTPTGGWIDGVYYDALLEHDVDYQLAHLHGLVYVRAHAILTVTEGIYASIEIAPGASLRLYGGGSSNVLSGRTAAVANRPGNAAQFTYVALTPQKLRIVTGGPLIGTVYAPAAAVEIESAALAEVHWMGSCWAQSLHLRAPLRFHYDENLRRVPLVPEL
jgi:hypothetical protein